MAEELLLRLDVRCDEQAPGVARAALNSLAAAGRAVTDLMLIASELVTNAILHSGCTSGDLLTLRLSRRDEQFVLAVRDPGRSGREAGVAEGRPLGNGGLGLRIVEMVATRWGQSRTDGYCVWAEIPMRAENALPRTSDDQPQRLTATSSARRH
jgi:anti-sigma regulatory factor (Ser/Thr protein kinase)